MALPAQIPTLDEFLERFPEFDTGTNDEKIPILIAEAAREVGDDWIVEDQKTAIMYLVAHLVFSESPGVSTKGQVVSESFGPMSRTYKTSQSDDLSTEYGRRWIIIRRRNVGAGIVLVGG